MPEHSLTTTEQRQEVESADTFERRIQEENNAQFEELRQQAQATFSAIKGSRAVSMHRSFSLGFPNAFDQAHGRTGSFLMVHGGCASTGCYAVTDPVVDEIWRLVTAALDNGQMRFPVHVFPFRMTDRNLRWRRGNLWEDFWADLKKGYDLFEQSRIPPLVSVCAGRYVFEAGRVEWATQPVEESCPPTIAGCLEGRFSRKGVENSGGPSHPAKRRLRDGSSPCLSSLLREGAGWNVAPIPTQTRRTRDKAASGLLLSFHSQGLLLSFHSQVRPAA
jgi:hypothetical protein